MEDVGRYRVIRRIAQGGMAEVFEGVALGPEGFQRRVAIKRMRAENAADPAFGRMFLDEAHIASQLHHANIVAVLDFGVADGFPFQVLEFVDGVDAGQLQELGAAAGVPMPVQLALAICTEIAHALEYAHRATGVDGAPAGIVHRDVSPGNILVGWSGDVKLTDFGIAFARGRLETTSAGLTKGTLLYMAPEQIMRGDIDGRSDVFALGCVLHALVAGRSPLAVESAMADSIAGKPLPLSRDLPDDIYDVVYKSTRLLKGDRFVSAGAMAGALGTALARRIDSDPRTLMREWLDQLRPRTPAVTAGRLDAFLGGELVFAGRKSMPPGFVEAGKSSPPTTGSSPEIERPRSRLPALLALGGALAVALTIVALAVAAKRKSDAETPVVEPAPLTENPKPTPPPETPTPPPPIDPPAPEPPTVTEPPPSTPRRPPRRPPPVATPTPPPAAQGSGTVTVGGSGALRAEILVDGAAKGYAPRALLLPVGSHEVVLVKPDGTRVTRTLQVQASHTPSAPLRWVVP